MPTTLCVLPLRVLLCATVICTALEPVVTGLSTQYQRFGYQTLWYNGAACFAHNRGYAANVTVGIFSVSAVAKEKSGRFYSDLRDKSSRETCVF